MTTGELLERLNRLAVDVAGEYKAKTPVVSHHDLAAILADVAAEGLED